MISRSNDRMVAGVLGGLAEHLGWSATNLRIVFVAVSVLSAAFPGIIVYGILWFLMPGPPDGHREFEVRDPDRTSGT